jgi:hypothetical protein
MNELPRSQLKCNGVRPNSERLMSDQATPQDPEPTWVLSVGAIFGGPEAQPWRDSVYELTRRVTVLREGVESQLNVNVVFHVPGRYLKPEFAGVRAGSFRKRDSLLMVQAALPPDLPTDPASYLQDAMVSAVDEAEAWSVRKSKGFDTAALHGLVRRL